MTLSDYTITEEEYQERDDLHELECSTQCGHYDELNQCCWVSWRNQDEGDRCFYGLYEDESGMIVRVLWKKKEAQQ
jgi:hypothetical protein